MHLGALISKHAALKEIKAWCCYHFCRPSVSKAQCHTKDNSHLTETLLQYFDRNLQKFLMQRKFRIR